MNRAARSRRAGFALCVVVALQFVCASVSTVRAAAPPEDAASAMHGSRTAPRAEDAGSVEDVGETGPETGPVQSGQLHQVQAGESVQAAIDAAAPGDTIRVQRGFYAENLRIDKPLRLIGIDRPTLSGSGRDDTIRVTASDVRIEGWIIRDSGSNLRNQNAGIYLQPGAHRAIVRHNQIIYNLFGLWIEKANDARIEHNRIAGLRDVASSQRGNGIQLYNTLRARILDNEISFVRDALYVDVSHDAIFLRNRLHHSRYGAHYMNSYRNLWEDNDSWRNRGGLALMEVRHQVVRNNRAWSNTDHGIMLRTIEDSIIEDNVAAANARGFFIYDGSFMELKRNLVIGNVTGVHISAGSIKNEVEANDFISNREQVRYVGAKDLSWGEKRGGNHWSNYLGWDRDGDGLGDVPYEANDMVDRLSWRFPMVKLLLASPAVQTLRMLGRQFPVLRVPSIVDPAPRMQPTHRDWSGWMDRPVPRGD